VRANIRALRERDPGGPGLERYDRAARLVTGKAGAEPEDLAAALAELAADLGIPGLFAWGVREADLAGLAADSLSSSSMKANPASLSAPEIEDLLRAAL
jgi:alcohol dehydrogenase class IV